MKSPILLLAFFAVILGGCTTAYKTGQTPDDVYYSPEPPQDEYVRVDRKDNSNRYYQGDETYYEDRYLRMKVQNRYQWSDLDDWYFYNNRYNYSHYNNYYWNNPWNPYSYWNQYYNPYGPSVIVVNPKSNYTYNKPRTFNLDMYNTQPVNNNANHPVGNSSNNGVRIFGSSNSNSVNTTSNPGRSLRDIFGGGSSSSSSSNNSSSAPERSSNNSSSSSSNSSSSSSSSGNSGSGSSNAPVRKF